MIGNKEEKFEKALHTIERNVDDLSFKAELAEMVLESSEAKVGAAMHMICETYKNEIKAFEDLRRGMSGYLEIEKPPRYAVINDDMEIDVIVDPHAG